MSTPDFRLHLQRQLAFLIRSCVAFDQGLNIEAIRIATVARVLLHQTKRSTSLLKHLNGTTIDLLSTCPPMGPSTLIGQGMGILQCSGEGGWKYLPTLGNGPFQQFIPASKWWDQDVMVQHPVRLSRRKIVLAAANQDGGTHVDEVLDPEYEALSTTGFAGSVTHSDPSGTTTRELEGSHFLCLRQIGYELLHSPALHKLAAG